MENKLVACSRWHRVRAAITNCRDHSLLDVVWSSWAPSSPACVGEGHPDAPPTTNAQFPVPASGPQALLVCRLGTPALAFLPTWDPLTGPQRAPSLLSPEICWERGYRTA